MFRKSVTRVIIFFDCYKQSKNSERYLQNHISEITLFQEAADILKRSDIDPEKLNLEAFRAEYFRMKKENETLAGKEKNLPQRIRRITQISLGSGQVYNSKSKGRYK